MKILYLGDIMGTPGQEVVISRLTKLRAEHQIDFVIAQGENLSEGKGMTIADAETMLAAGVDFFTGGNWTLHREEITPWLEDTDHPVIRPANYPAGTPGKGWKIVETTGGKALIVSLLGQIVGAFPAVVDNPLRVIDEILEETKDEKIAIRIVNFHGDYSSEKRVIGQYLDGKVTAVIGDHWHVPTADAMVLPKGTAHITDVGMVGSLDSCLGVKTDVILDRWRSGHSSKNELETDGRRQLCGVLIEVDTTTGLAKRIDQITEIIPS